jgi:hypothetical protein
MTKRILRTIGIAAIAGVLIATIYGAYLRQSAAQNSVNQSADQSVQLGQTAAFSVNPVDAASYQWLHNAVAIDGQTNSTLTIEDAQISDAGLYSCTTVSGADIVSTATASLTVYAINPDILGIVVYGTPIVSGGSSGTCPGEYAGYVNYIKTAQQGWGWAPSTNTTIYTASDTTQTNTKVEYVGDYGDEGCNKTTVTIPYPAASPVYRFTIYFTNNVPSTNYPITLTGFNP